MSTTTLGKVRAFLMEALRPSAFFAIFAGFSRRLTNFIFSFADFRGIMAARRDSGQDVGFVDKYNMVALKTKEECRLGNDTIQVWTVEMPSKHAEGILRVIKNHIPGQDAVDLQHLRRFAKPKFLPSHLLVKRDVVKDMKVIPQSWSSTPATVMQAPASTAWEYSTPVPLRNNSRSTSLHLLVCPTRVICKEDLYALLLEYPPFCSSPDSWGHPLEIQEITVPVLAPTSPEQALVWSQQYWPTFYRKTNPFGAHPVSMEAAEKELQEPQGSTIDVEAAMELAEQVGDETRRRGVGAGPGCVVLERVDDQVQIISVAGDARDKLMSNQTGSDGTAGCSGGNPMGHAVMRAIGMVGRKRLRVASQPLAKTAAKAESTFATCGLIHDEKSRDEFFNDLPITPIEEEHFVRDNLKPDGYLCLKLEFILTHEPCIMCSMALVHSRVGRVVFKHRMPKTGGLTAEVVRNDTGPVGLGYGLCWRKELNWQFMCWEYIPPDDQGTAHRQTRQGSFDEKYTESDGSQNTVSADDCTSSFASIHV